MRDAEITYQVSTGARRPTAFIVDNEQSIRASLLFLLESAGVAAVGFETAEAFLAACTPDQPGCLVLDVRLPGMSGVALQKRLDEFDIMLPVIIITGFADVDTAVKVLKGGAFDFFEKPFADELLLDRVRQAIAVDQRRRAIRAVRDRLAARMARLTVRERAVFDQVVQGKANKVVAIEFGISEKTVEAHRARVMHKLGASSLAELVRMDLAASQLDTLYPTAGIAGAYAQMPAMRSAQA
jgi:FixJ family two-component response regulator